MKRKDIAKSFYETADLACNVQGSICVVNNRTGKKQEFDPEFAGLLVASALAHAGQVVEGEYKPLGAKKDFEGIIVAACRQYAEGGE